MKEDVLTPVIRPERPIQNHVVALFLGTLDDRALGNWEKT